MPSDRMFRAAAAAGVLIAALALAGCAHAEAPGFGVDRGAPDDPLVDPGDGPIDPGDGVPEPGPNARSPELEFTDSAGTTSSYRLFPPAGDPAATTAGHPVGLILDFHGDGGYDYLFPDDPGDLGGPDGIIAAGTSRGYAVVPVLAPVSDDDDLEPEGRFAWWGAGERNARFAHELLLDLERQMPVDRSDIWLVGYSGGAQFITQYLLPAYSSDLDGGGAVMFGGGGAPAVDAGPFDPGLRSTFPMFWLSGADDLGDPLWGGYSGYDEAAEGRAWYSLEGFATDGSFPEGVDHALAGWFGPVLAERLDVARRERA